MTIETSYTEARANFAKLCDRVVEDREIVFIKRRGSADVALIAADDLSSLEETAYLLRSPKNAERLLTALHRALERSGESQTIDVLRQELGMTDGDSHPHA